MKRFIWILMLFCMYFQATAHQEYRFLLHKDNVFLEYTEGFPQYELSNQIYAIFELVNLHISSNYPDYNKNIYIELVHDYTNYQENLTLLGIDSLKSVQVDSRKFEEVEGKDIGLRLFLLRDVFRAKEILNLIDYGIKYRDSIVKSQEKIGYDEFMQNGKNVFGYEGLSIPKDVILEITTAENALVNTTIDKKIYRNGEKIKCGEINYFYQNDTFIFLSNPFFLPWNSSDPVDSNKVLLKTSMIKQIIGNFNDGYLIFDTDSSFFYINPLQNMVKGKHFISNCGDCYQPIFKYEYEKNDTIHNVLEKFYFWVNTYGFEPRKILYLPIIDTAIVDYHLLENKLIENLVVPPKVEGRSNDKLYVLAGVIFILSIIVVLYFKKSN